MHYSCGAAAQMKEWEVKTQDKRELRVTEGSPSSCCRRKTKEGETHERNEKTAGVIAIDLSAISANVSC